MKEDIVWQPFTLQFKQSYDGAYGYLDHCGDFVSRLRESFGFYATETILTGCSLELPEERMFLTANSNELSLNCEAPKDDRFFLDVAEFASKTAVEIFHPFEVFRNSLVLRVFKSEATLEKANDFSLSVFGNEYAELADTLSLQPSTKEIKIGFKSGSYEFDIQSQSVVLSVNGRNITVPQNRISKAQHAYVDKVREVTNKRVFEPGYGVMLTLELSEKEPPPTSLAAHLKLLRDYQQIVTSKTR